MSYEEIVNPETGDTEALVMDDGELVELDVWSNPDIVPFTKRDREMLTEVHALLTGAAKAFEDVAPKLMPMLGAMGISL